MLGHLPVHFRDQHMIMQDDKKVNPVEYDGTKTFWAFFAKMVTAL
jgi:hypothetical protein